MIVANTDYTSSLLKIEQLKTLILELEENIYDQIPQGITNEFDSSKLIFLNSLEEMEITLIEFGNNENE
jgi:hypothetical protein